MNDCATRIQAAVAAGCTLGVLRELGDKSSGDPVISWPLPPDDPERLAGEVIETAKGDAAGRPGARYALVFLREDGSPWGRFSFPVGAKEEAIADGTGSAVMADLQRHNREIMRMLLEQSDATKGQLSELVALLMTEKKEAEMSRLQAFELLKELTDSKRDFEVRKFEVETKAQRDRHAITALAPIATLLSGQVVGQLTGKKIDLSSPAFKAFFEGLSDKQRELFFESDFFNSLEPEQQGAIAQVFQEYQKHDEDAAKKDAAKETNGAASHDAGGAP